MASAVDFDNVNEQIDQALAFFEQEDTLTELISDAQTAIVRLTSDDRDYDIFVSTQSDMLEYAKENNNVVIYGNDDFINALVDAVFWIEAISPTGENTTFVIAGYVSTALQ